MSDHDENDCATAHRIERSRRLADLDGVLGQCERALDRMERHRGGDVQGLRDRIHSARGELNRLRGLAPPLPIDRARREFLDRLRVTPDAGSPGPSCRDR